MQHPLERVPPERRRATMLALLALTLALVAALVAIDASLRSPVTPLGVVSYELCAWDGSCAAALEAYRPVRLEAGMSIGLDYLFMPAYASALGAALVFAARGRMRRLASGLAWAVTLAALLDAIENAALYAMLATGEAGPTLAWTATLPATIKLVILVVALLALPVVALSRREA
jgi:hypothetical protein